MAQRAPRSSTSRASRWPTARARGSSCRSRSSRSSWAARPTPRDPSRADGPARRSPAPAAATPSASASRSTSRAPACAASKPAALDLEVDAREVDQATTEDEELRSPYVEDDELDIGRWAHDAALLALPTRFLCRPDCAGLCPVCGESLNDADPADHEHEQPHRPPLGRAQRPEAGVAPRRAMSERRLPLGSSRARSVSSDGGDALPASAKAARRARRPALRRGRRAGRGRAARRRGTSAG